MSGTTQDILGLSHQFTVSLCTCNTHQTFRELDFQDSSANMCNYMLENLAPHGICIYTMCAI